MVMTQMFSRRLTTEETHAVEHSIWRKLGVLQICEHVKSKLEAPLGSGAQAEKPRNMSPPPIRESFHIWAFSIARKGRWDTAVPKGQEAPIQDNILPAVDFESSSNLRWSVPPFIFFFAESDEGLPSQFS
jgi:hypothetical protein